MVDASKVRAWYAHRQGLDGSLQDASPATVFERAGWARSVGGVAPYLTLFSRAGINREQADASAAGLEIYELPSARGCTYVLPASDFALGLTVGQAFAGEIKTAQKLGVTAKEIDKLCDAVISALEKGTLSPDELRQAVGKAVRNLGPEGQKKGLTTTLPVALEQLQARGEIRRVPTNGRFDQQRYQYALWRPNPLRGFRLGVEEAYIELARRFFTWIAPAYVAEFQWFSGLGVKAAKAAVEPLKLDALGPGDERMFLPGDRATFEAFRPPKDPQYALIGGIDSLFLLRRDLKSLLDPKDLGREVPAEKGTRPLGGLADLPDHAITDRGRLVGLWEYDTASESIAWTSFVKKDKPLLEAVARTEQFVKAQLGDARSFSLDTPKSREPRVAALRKAAGA
ncbi:MAG TPA: crosslink repair DNA glycosylase YcaQ family protein [Bryobacteraceae bacterium]|nr:crosslink repair DNA glycosylase YcaQ family protein [Bryobacteraceae bacterium]